MLPSDVSASAACVAVKSAIPLQHQPCTPKYPINSIPTLFKKNWQVQNDHACKVASLAQQKPSAGKRLQRLRMHAHLPWACWRSAKEAAWCHCHAVAATADGAISALTGGTSTRLMSCNALPCSCTCQYTLRSRARRVDACLCGWGQARVNACGSLHCAFARLSSTT